MSNFFFFLFNVRVGMFLFNTEFPRIYLVFITHHSQHLQQNVIDCGKYKILLPFRKSILNYLNVVYIKTVHKSYITLLSDPFNILEPPSCSFRSTRNCSKQTFLENSLSRQCTRSFVPSVLTPFILDMDKEQSLILQERQLFRCTWEASYKLQQCFAVWIPKILSWEGKNPELHSSLVMFLALPWILTCCVETCRNFNKCVLRLQINHPAEYWARCLGRLMLLIGTAAQC